MVGFGIGIARFCKAPFGQCCSVMVHSFQFSPHCSILVSIFRTWLTLFAFSQYFAILVGIVRSQSALDFDGYCTVDIVGSWSVSLGLFQN